MPLPSALSVPTGVSCFFPECGTCQGCMDPDESYVLQGARWTHRRNPRSLALGTTLHGPTVALFSCLCGSPGHQASSCQEHPAHSSLHWLAGPRMRTDQPTLLTARGGGGARPVANTAPTVSLHERPTEKTEKKSQRSILSGNSLVFSA